MNIIIGLDDFGHIVEVGFEHEGKRKAFPVYIEDEYNWVTKQLQEPGAVKVSIRGGPLTKVQKGE